MSMGTGMGRDGDATTGAMGATAHGGDGLDGREAARGAGAPAGAAGLTTITLDDVKIEVGDDAAAVQK